MTKPWAGHRLTKVFPEIAAEVPAGTGETIEAASFDAAQTIVANGSAAGKTIEELIRLEGWRELIGVESTDLPVMLKLLDAAEPLSVQVHPGDILGAPGGPPIRRGKDECWLVLDAEPDAIIWQGIKSGLGFSEVWRLLESGRIDEVLHARRVGPGDFIDNPAGMVHAIGGALVLLELQQACATTWRIFDWAKPGASMRQRPLHTRDAKSASRLELPLPDIIGVAPEGLWPLTNGLGSVPGQVTQEITVLRDTGPFSWRSLVITAPLRNRSRVARARLLTVLSGGAVISSGDTSVEFWPPDTVMLPAGLRDWSLAPIDGAAWVMDARVNS